MRLPSLSLMIYHQAVMRPSLVLMVYHQARERKTMYLLLTLSLLASPVQASKSADTTQIALLRYQLQEKFKKDLDQQQTAIRAEFENFKRELREETAQNVQAAKEDLRRSINIYILIGGVSLAVVTFVLSFLGYDRIKSFIASSTAKFDKRIDDAIYRTDPRDMPIKLPQTGMEKQIARLKKLEFRDISAYPWLDESCTRNAVVYLATTDDEARKLKQFIEDKKLAEREDVAFVVYTKGVRIDQNILRDLDNVTFANNHLTLVQALFVAARGMKR